MAQAGLGIIFVALAALLAGEIFGPWVVVVAFGWTLVWVWVAVLVVSLTSAGLGAGAMAAVLSMAVAGAGSWAGALVAVWAGPGAFGWSQEFVPLLSVAFATFGGGLMTSGIHRFWRQKFGK